MPASLGAFPVHPEGALRSGVGLWLGPYRVPCLAVALCVVFVFMTDVCDGSAVRGRNPKTGRGDTLVDAMT